MLRRVGAWRRSAHGTAPLLRTQWFSSAAGNGDGACDLSETAAWSLVQRDGTRRTTAAGGGSGAVHLEQCYEEHPASSSSSGSSGSGSRCQEPASSFSLTGVKQATLSQLQATFLPSGYPRSVAPGYLHNTMWQAVHHAAGSANGVLASTFLLYSVGLGAGAVPTAGALNWVLKDGLGQAGTLLFGKAIAHNFDVSSRAWYLLASAKLNLAMGLEICTFLLPHYFLPIGAVANAIKGLSWMAGGSTKSVFKVAFAADNNFGDVSAKATSQTICASLVGTSAGVALASQIGQSVGLAMGCYAALAGVHMWAGYRAVRLVPLATLNPSRLELLIDRFLAAQQAQQAQALHATAAPAGGGQTAAAAAVVALPTPSELARRDPVLHSSWLHIGTPLRRLVARHGDQLGSLLQQQQQQQQQQVAEAPAAGQAGSSAAPPAPLHLLLPDGGSGGGMHLLLHERAESADCILGYLHAYLVRHGLHGSDSASSGSGGGRSGDGSAAKQQQQQQQQQVAGSLAEARRLLPGLLAALEAAGWDDQKVVLEPKRRRVCW